MSDSSDFDATAIQTPAANKIGQAWKENGNTSPTPKNLGSTKSGTLPKVRLISILVSKTSIFFLQMQVTKICQKETTPLQDLHTINTLYFNMESANGLDVTPTLQI